MSNKNYYQILGITPSATVAEVETAVEGHYNKWRRLVTHHDPNVVTRANQALQAIERIRTTLTAPDKRAVYDAGIGLGGAIGGLGDPDAILQQAGSRPVPPSPPPGTQRPPGVDQRVDAWTCSKCQTMNAIKTRFCKKCGQQLGKECPKCREWIEAIAVHCPECGIDIDKFAKRKARAEREVQRIGEEINIVNRRIQQLESNRQSVPSIYSEPVLYSVVLLGGVLLIIFGLIALGLIAFPVYKVVGGILFLIGVVLCGIYRTLASEKKRQWQETIKTNVEPINQQISKLEAKANQLQDEIKQWNSDLEG